MAVEMHFGDRRAGARFFLSLSVLVAMLAAVAALGLLGLRAVERANEQVFSDNFRTTEANGQLVASLDGAIRLSLEVLSSSGSGETERLRARLRSLAIPRAQADIDYLLRLHADDPPSELRQIEQIPKRWREYLAVATHGPVLSGARQLTSPERTAAVANIEHVLDPLTDFVAARQGIETREAASAHVSARHVFERSRNWLIAAVAVALLAAAALVRVGLLLRALLGARAEERRYEESANEYIGVLQGTENEEEAQALVRRQIERSHPSSRAVVLVRNNSDNRLEARTSLAELEDLRDPLVDAPPRSCLAVRFSRSHTEGAAHAPLTKCELCGRLPGVSLCEPLLVGGEVIGSVLVAKAQEPDAEERRRVRETVAQAAPVLGNLRNLALAELRAATDALTGLPNHRAVQDTLKRMVAQASRTFAPLALVIIDLDHFKSINDVHGHDRGDEMLAAVGTALQRTIRASDFAGRYGGEEFVALLPSADRQSAIHVAEGIRAAVAAIRIPGVEETITASAGVAILPDDGGDAATLFKAADRALYAAKHAGRDRVEVAGGDQPRVADAVAAHG
jgi:diguanylate cyclase (GGDEF)-like protein